jgi:outer membrane protein OmpA-like peptidoglycan-associated protein
MRDPVAFLLSTCVSLFALSGQAGDVEGGRDDPRLGRFEGAEIRVYKQIEFDEFPYITGPYVAALKAPQKIETVEGALTLIGYQVPKGTSYAQLARNYRLRLEEQGFTVDFECDTAKAECGDALPFAELIRKPTPQPNPGWYDWDRFHYRFMSAHIDQIGVGRTFATIWITKYSNSEEPVYVYVSVLEQAAMEYKMVDAAAMAKGLAGAGHIALYGIQFDTDKADIKDASRPTLAEIAQLLKGQSNLALAIVGHTDNQGTLEYNMELSNRRAQAVRTALINEYGVGPTRLSAWGAGFLAPVASNSTEEGRAQNRRVELVAQ